MQDVDELFENFDEVPSSLKLKSSREKHYATTSTKKGKICGVKITYNIGYFKPLETKSREPTHAAMYESKMRWYQYHLPDTNGCVVCFCNGDALWLVDKIEGVNIKGQPHGTAVIFRDKHSFTEEELMDIFDNLPLSSRSRLLENIGKNNELKFSYKSGIQIDDTSDSKW